MCADLQEYNGNMHKTVHLYLMVLVAALFTYGSQCAAQTDLSGHTQVIQYTDDFSSDKAFHDCWTRSPIWIDGASPPTHPYLIYEEAKNGRSLCFMSPNNETETLSYRLPEAATLSYCLPIDPGNGHPVEPLVLEIEIDVDFLPIENPDGPSAAYLVYYTSADGITWPDQPEATTPGLNRLSFDSLGQNRYIMLRGINARIKTFKTSVYRPPGHILVPDDVPTIQDAIDMSQNGDRIIVADNRYDGPIHFKGKSIYLMSANGPAGCIIDGQSQGRAVVFDQGESRAAVLDGFTIQNGIGDQGSGIYCKNSSPTIANCIIENCTGNSVETHGQGAGLYCETGRPLIQACVFRNNRAYGRAGGQGGAVYVADNTSVEIIQCRFSGNAAEEGSDNGSNTIEYAGGASGGAVFIGTSPTTANPSPQSLLKNCLFYENFAGDDGGAICLYRCRALITHCTLSGNTANNSGGGVFANLRSDFPMCTVKNTISWANTPSDVAKTGPFSAEDLTVLYSHLGDQWPGSGSGTNNDTLDPLFADPQTGDFHLLSYTGRWDAKSRQWVHDAMDMTSPCIDTGDSADPIGAERSPDGNNINMGAYGGTAQASKGYGSLIFHIAEDGNDYNNGLTPTTAFASIQEAVDRAIRGDTVMIWPGKYDEAVVFNGEDITVQGAADAPVVHAPAGHAFSFQKQEGPECILRNIVIANCPDAGIFSIAATPTFHNLTVVNNQVGIRAEELTRDIRISNCIFWGNSQADLLGCTATYSCMEMPIPGLGNFSEDPLFVDPDKCDYHLQSRYGRHWPDHDVWVVDQATSPCIDAGNSAIFPTEEPQSNGMLINIGAYGGTGYSSMSPPWHLCDEITP